MKPTIEKTVRLINSVIEEHLSRLDPREADRLHRNATEYVKALQSVSRKSCKQPFSAC